MKLPLETPFIYDHAEVLNCEIMKTYFIYLGILIGANHRKASTWELIVQKFESNLSTWKQRSLSIGGRVTLINSILNFFLTFIFPFVFQDYNLCCK